MKCVLVLSHLMSKKGLLGDESIARAKKAINVFKTKNLNFLITSGWAYRSDCDLLLCDVFKEYIKKNSQINPEKIITLPDSRDTVGDAFFCLKKTRESCLEELFVVTSDYHVPRVEKIFYKFFLHVPKIEIIGTKTSLLKNKDVLKREAKSIESFEKTFSSVNFTNINSIYQCLIKNHPLYNGEVYSNFN